MRAPLFAGLLLACLLPAAPSRGDAALHSLWEVHGKHNTVYLLGSIHVLRSADYPLAPAVLDAYANAGALVMEINLAEEDVADIRQEMLDGALLPDGKTLAQVLGAGRYARAQRAAHGIGVDLGGFDRYAPWFVAEAVSQIQLAQQGFEPQSGVEMYFLGKARADRKAVTGLETAHDQVALFEAMPLESQAEYLVSSLHEAQSLPKEVDEMVRAWQHGDTRWFSDQLKQEFGQDPRLYRSLLGDRNRKWLPKIEALLNEDQNYLVIVGNGHLAGQDNVIELLKRDGIAASQR